MMNWKRMKEKELRRCMRNRQDSCQNLMRDIVDELFSNFFPAAWVIQH
jgi:hypothetical protein